VQRARRGRLKTKIWLLPCNNTCENKKKSSSHASNVCFSRAPQATRHRRRRTYIIHIISVCVYYLLYYNLLYTIIIITASSPPPPQLPYPIGLWCAQLPRYNTMLNCRLNNNNNNNNNDSLIIYDTVIIIYTWTRYVLYVHIRRRR